TAGTTGPSRQRPRCPARSPRSPAVERGQSCDPPLSWVAQPRASRHSPPAPSSSPSVLNDGHPSLASYRRSPGGNLSPPQSPVKKHEHEPVPGRHSGLDCAERWQVGDGVNVEGLQLIDLATLGAWPLACKDRGRGRLTWPSPRVTFA